MTTNKIHVRALHPGMGQAVAERTVLRKVPVYEMQDGDFVETGKRFETWGEVADRVATGNALLHPDTYAQEKPVLEKHIANMSLLMSGRHLQHGDSDQPNRPYEVFSNCSTSATSFILFMLLLNGSGVGRSYDDSMCVVNWNYAPNLRVVLDTSHPDFDWSQDESVRDGKHKYAGENVIWHEVADTREGWAKAIEKWETLAYQKVYADHTLVLDFSKVRPRGAPIMGMQGRPSSGPKPLMNALMKCATVKGAGMRPWKQAIYIDHYLAECVLVGGARRAARMSTKSWRDKDILDFIQVKRPIEYQGMTMDEVLSYRAGQASTGGYIPLSFLWSSNNSVMVDAEFWDLVKAYRTAVEAGKRATKDARQAWVVMTAICDAAYGDGTGEPGLINADKLHYVDSGWDEIEHGYVGSKRFQVEDDTKILLSRLVKQAKSLKYKQITNPCMPEWTTLLTPDGIKLLANINIGDMVWSETGWTKIVNKWSTGVKPVYRYTTTAGDIDLTSNHRVVSNGVKIEAGGAESIDPLVGVVSQYVLDLQDIMDGLVVGDGQRLTGMKYPRLLIGENDGDYLTSEIAPLLVRQGERSESVSWTVKTTLVHSEMVPTYERVIPERFFFGSPAKMAGFLRGLFSANGCVLEKYRRVHLTTSCREQSQQVQIMLSALGIFSYITNNKPTPTTFADGKTYTSKGSYNVNIPSRYLPRFSAAIGFIHKYKTDKLLVAIADQRAPRRPIKTSYEIISEEYLGDFEVWDLTVDNEPHTFWSNGFNISNCGEISLSVLAGYCILCDVVPFHCDTLDDAEEAFRVATRALIRVNLMDNLYAPETRRTNRIGVGITGVHEFAYKFFGIGFREMIDPENNPAAQDFWNTMARFSRAAQDEAAFYSSHLGLNAPHTITTCKPSGSVSKLCGVTEGWHLPAMAQYLRWVQFRNDDPLVETYKSLGYPARELKSYSGTTIIGFPTQPVIATLGMGDKLVTAQEATPEEQYKWVQLGEKYWLDGDLENAPSNQISYTLKYDTNIVGYEEFRDMLIQYQSQIRCCSVLPIEDTSAYEYLPEETITKAHYEELVHAIKSVDVTEDIAFEHLDCATGACPVDFVSGDK